HPEVPEGGSDGQLRRAWRGNDRSKRPTTPPRRMSMNPHLLLPVGTQVVALVEVRGADGRPAHPRGAVGVVVQAPADYWHAYRVRFPDGHEAALKRQELSVLAHYKQGQIGQGSGGPL